MKDSVLLIFLLQDFMNRIYSIVSVETGLVTELLRRFRFTKKECYMF